MHTDQYLKQAWEVIDSPEKWSIRYRHNVSTGQRCALGALDTVYRYRCGTSEDYDKAVEALVAVIPDWHDDYHHACTIVALYNNSHSWEQVRDWWQDAIAYARRQRNQSTVDELVKVPATTKVLEPV